MLEMSTRFKLISIMKAKIYLRNVICENYLLLIIDFEDPSVIFFA